MFRLLRFLLAVALLPFAWAMTLVCGDVFRQMSTTGAGFFSSEGLAVLAGVLGFLLVWMFLPAPVRVYVLGHELTHALWGILFGARVGNLKVGLRGGSVTLTKSNFLITLAPYFFPFYTVLVVLVALVTRIFVAPLPCSWAWLFAVGFTWCLHACFTIQSLLQTQPDIQECGHLFSYVLIWTLNVAGVVLWILCTTEVSFAAAGHSLWTQTHDVYLFLFNESVRAFSLLRR